MNLSLCLMLLTCFRSVGHGRDGPASAMCGVDKLVHVHACAQCALWFCKWGLTARTPGAFPLVDLTGARAGTLKVFLAVP